MWFLDLMSDDEPEHFEPIAVAAAKLLAKLENQQQHERSEHRTSESGGEESKGSAGERVTRKLFHNDFPF